MLVLVEHVRRCAPCRFRRDNAAYGGKRHHRNSEQLESDTGPALVAGIECVTHGEVVFAVQFTAPCSGQFLRYRRCKICEKKRKG